jgi:hypothetical protein
VPVVDAFLLTAVAGLSEFAAVFAGAAPLTVVVTDVVAAVSRLAVGTEPRTASAAPRPEPPEVSPPCDIDLFPVAEALPLPALLLMSWLVDEAGTPWTVGVDVADGSDGGVVTTMGTGARADVRGCCGATTKGGAGVGTRVVVFSKKVGADARVGASLAGAVTDSPVVAAD